MKTSRDEKNQFLKEIYSEYFEELFRYAKAITNSSDLAKDVVSDVFLYILNSKTELKYIQNIRAYLLKSVKNSAIRVLALNPMNIDYDQDDNCSSITEDVNPHNLLLGKELEGFLGEILNGLPPYARLVFEMIRQKDMSYEEVAVEMGISVHTVRNHLVSVNKAIKQKLNNLYKERTHLKLVNGSN